MGLSKSSFTALTIGAAGVAAAAGFAMRDPHPVVSVNERGEFLAPAPAEAMVPAQAIDGVEYNSEGQIVAARIDGLEAPASASAVKGDVPVS